ncbi:hypothetical protein M3Y99_01867500 [Aphelenchoides fujianensis]|nr:hypothetical protein M3Y99_01867500 [Aphelenchoides fujianensis]
MPPSAVRPLRPRSALVIDHRPPTFGGEHFLPSGTRLPAHWPHWRYTLVSKLKGGFFEHAVRSFSRRASPFFSARAAHCCEELASLDDLERLFHVLLPLFGHAPVVSIADHITACEDDGEERMFAAKRAFWSEKPPNLPPPLADLWPLIADSRRSQWPPYSKAEKLVHSHRLFLASVEGEEPLAAFPHFLS